LFTALAFVDANDMVFAVIEKGMGQGGKAVALWTHTKFELRQRAALNGQLFMPLPV
jgi:hypothetical protein